MVISRKQLIKKYINFFKKHSHKEIPSASLIPENDPTVLFTTAGMHPLVPFLTGSSHPLGKKLVNVQKCLRTGDIEEIGNTTHHTFFEMLGNWSLGDYWKKESISMSYEFLIKELKIPKEKLAITCFAGDNDAPRDTESYEAWLALGIPKERIKFLGKKDNWWGPAGTRGPCGPDTEIFYWNPVSKKTAPPKKFDPSDSRWIEIWNNVFMQYNKVSDSEYLSLSQKNVDTGLGVERTLAILNNLDDNYLTSIFTPIIKQIEKISNKKYSDEENKKPMRIIADHIRSATLILGDPRAVKPSNIQQGYVLRRLIRRAIRYAKLLSIKENFTSKIAQEVIKIYESSYPELKKNKNFILTQLDEEENKFLNTLERGLNKFEKFSQRPTIEGKEAFLLFQSYGFPIEMTLELAKEKKVKVDEKGFYAELKKHQELSRTATAGTFKSGLADHSEKTICMHTAAHLLHAALHKVLGPKAVQRGSNITPERIRFDFAFDRKLTSEEIKQIEEFINDKISRSLPVEKEELPLKKAFDSGAQGEFGHKYPDIVSVYTILDKTQKSGYCSREICTGPHVKNTSEIKHFKIVKEESSSSGVRRIRAIIED